MHTFENVKTFFLHKKLVDRYFDRTSLAFEIQFDKSFIEIITKRKSQNQILSFFKEALHFKDERISVEITFD